jgi:hypothetical protein
MQEQMEEQALSNALAESLRDHQQMQQQHALRRQQPADVRPSIRVDFEAVSGAVQVPNFKTRAFKLACSVT